MAQYLDRFKGVIGKRQSEQILKILNKQRNSGQIRSVEEFTKKLSQLMNELTSTVLQPSLKIWIAEQDGLIDSERHNFMLDRVQDDLEAAFEEARKIDEVQTSHEAIVRDVILKNLRAGVAELESKVTLFEFLNKDLRGFDSAIFSTFRESKEGRTQRSAVQEKVLFVDPREGDLISSTQDAAVELVGERLTLPNDSVTYHNITDIQQIFDDESPQSEMIVVPPGMKLRNLIDNTKGTYWIQSLLFSELQSYVKTKLELRLGVVREVNFIEIEPASKRSIVLESIHYVDGNNIVTDLSIDEQVISGPVGIRIRKTATNRIILTFRNENADSVQFEYTRGGSNTLFDQALAEIPEGERPTISKIAKDLDEVIPSAKIKEYVGVVVPENDVFSGYQFTSGFDNIKIGLTSFGSRGIYISEPLELENMGEVGLKTLESRPYRPLTGGVVRFTDETYDNDSSNELTFSGSTPTGGREFLGSIEYWIIRQDLTADNKLLKTTVFPILPLGVQRIHQERLVLTEKSNVNLSDPDIGRTIFFTNRTVSEGNIKVYRNGLLLDDETGNDDATDGWKHYDYGDAAYTRPNTGIPMAFRIQIVSSLPGDIFTVSYTPLTSSTRVIPKELSDYSAIGGLKVIDLVGDLSARLEDSKVIILDKPVKLAEAIKTKVYLSIILRQNTAEQSLTPAVEEYTLVAGYQDKTKFEED